MKIIFICGSLEPGQDGVGDYTRRLAGELIKQGHQTAAIALYEKHLYEMLDGRQETDDIMLPVLRISANCPNSLRFSTAGKWVNKFNPEWISLQYVPYSFHAKGIPINLAWDLNKIGRNVRWHIMVHEPYVASAKKLKFHVVSTVQIFILILLKKRLHPVWHTSNFHYQKLLSRIGIRNQILGLFGNISVHSPFNCVSGEKNQNKLLAVYFGKEPPVSHFKYFTTEIHNYFKHQNIQLQLIFCGRAGSALKVFADKISAIHSQVEVKLLGELDPINLSKQFAISDFGIARVPYRLLGKSGSAISMLEHGLPLWIPVLESPMDEKIHPSLFRPELCSSNLSETIKNIDSFKHTINRLTETGKKMIEDLALSKRN